MAPGIRKGLIITAGCLLGLVSARATPAQVDFTRLSTIFPAERVQQTLTDIVGDESRVAGYPGAAAAALYIKECFQDIGLDNITVQEYDVSVPVEEEGGILEITKTGERVSLHGLWPNLVKTSTLAEGGIQRRLIDGGSGDYSQLDGKNVERAMVLMDFNTGDAWLNSAYLGADGIVFIEPDSTVTLEGERKFLTMPLDVPRFWVSKEDGQILRERIAADPMEGIPVHMAYRMDWERRPAWNIYGVIPGHDPLMRDEVVVLESYYDAMSVVPALAPGAEQAAGITALIELARYFRDHPPARTVVFLATSAHHLSLRGVDDFVQRYMRREEPFVERMLIRRVIEAALVRDIIQQDGVTYTIGLDEYLGKESLIRGVAEDDTVLVQHIADAAILDGIIEQNGDGLVFNGSSFGSRADLMQRLVRNDDLRLDLYREWVGPQADTLDVKLFISLDLSTQTEELGVWNSHTSFYYRRYFAPFGANFMRYAREISRQLGYDPRDVLVNGISPEGGMTWETLVPGDISVNSELALATGTPSLAFVTVHDSRFRVDTPLDRTEEVNFDNLTKQIRVLAGMFHLAFDDPELFPDFRMRLRDTLRSLKARTMVFPRRSIVPDLPRTGAVGVIRNGQKKSYKGVRGEYYEIVDQTGAFYINRVRVNTVQIEGYYMDPATGQITYAPDRGEQGDRSYPMRIAMDWRDKQWQVVLFPCRAFNLYDLVDPRFLTKLSEITIFDQTNTAPVEYGYTIGEGPSAMDEPTGVLFARPGHNIKVGLGAGILGFRYLLLNSAYPDYGQDGLGIGYRIEEGTTFARTTFLAARDMWSLNEARMKELDAFGIENRRLIDLHRRARDQLDRARDAAAERRWSAFVRYTRAAIGLESRAYPDVRGTQNDVIQGIIFFMALVLPCAFFTERLLITAATIRNQIIGFVGVFLSIWVILWLVHPAFQLSNPVVILLAFVILVLAIMVMSIISGRFNEQMRKLRTEVAVIHDTDVSRSGASAAAFQLGISNMKRRKLRTALTFVTLLLLTFTVLSFTSIQSTLRFNQIQRPNEGQYRGMLIRSRAWNPLEDSVLDYVRSNFRDIGQVAARSWYANQTKAAIRMRHGDRTHNALGVLGLTPEERYVTGMDRTLIAGRWFQEGDVNVCILPSDMVREDRLNIDLGRMGEQQVLVFGEMYTVIGVVDSRRLRDLRDLDDAILTPADFAVTGGQAVQEIAEQERREREGLEDAQVVIRPFVHLEPANVLILPYRTLRNVGAGNPLQSVAVRFDDDVDEREQIEEFLSRLAVTLFAGIQEEGDEHISVSIYSSLGMTSFSGMGNLFVPILIASLIVLNTMMGSVYERFREIGIYSSVGLAPGHIAWLFMAESCVYSVLGVVAGYLTGQSVAKILIELDLLAGFTLNYSSTSAVFASILVMAVVMLSTVYPARKASEMAVPDVTRKWKLPPPEGDEWNFDFPFTVSGHEVLGLSVFLIGYFDSYSEESIGTFYTDGARLDRIDTANGEGYSISMNIWLAPFDLGVSQHVIFRATPEPEHNIYSISLQITRMSGEEASWRRVNQRFMNVIRKQFLIWRTVNAEAKAEYRLQGEQILAGEKSQVTA